MQKFPGRPLMELTEQEIWLVRNGGPAVSYPAGHQVFSAGEIADRVYFILEGLVKIFRLTECGNHCTVALRYPGDFIGLAEVLYGGQRTFYSQVMLEAKMVMIQKSVLESLFLQHPGLAIKVAQIMGARLREAQSSFFELASYQVPGRLALLLLKMAERLGEKSEDGIKIKVKFTHEEMAYMIGTSRPTVTAALKIFEKEKSIKKSKSGEIVVLRFDKLHDWV